MSVASGGSASSLTERARAASSSSRPDDDATLRFNRVDGGGDGRKGAIPVYVMLPLDTVSRDGRLQRVDALSAQLARLASAGVAGVMVDVWWGIVERARPMEYDWDAYLQLASIVGSLGLKLHAVLSFHACGANRDDDYHVPLPSWVTDAVNRDPDGLLFMDRAGTRSDEYISLFADDSPMPMLATPIDCYRDMMISFRDAFREYISPPNAVVDEILVGAGPCGELRYPAYAMSRGWEFPGVGEFQCYDRRALESLAAAANAVGRPEWGGAGPHDAGSYNSHPDDTDSLAAADTPVGRWDSDYGRFFLTWYSDELVSHGERVLTAAREAFDGVGARLAIKCAGIHWWYRTRAHAAELTTGGRGIGFGGSGYDKIMALCKRSGASVTFTCAEMADKEHTPFHKCGPEGLLRQVVNAAERHGVEISAENALFRCDGDAFRQTEKNCGANVVGDAGTSRAARMHSFTFLRLCDTLMEEGNFAEFAKFVRNMSAGAAGGSE
ncbi:glycoside hydrolase family 14 protein [Micromonas pusilla CCMP1545]|uniref:Beta-amylase n=1 Tax=Micromonas pusilla (strain CCMP1545) TaxID=564608 RepID=C1MYQ4_MICPC|nr:glycoside hydrolase family 14 protein [Micromonas pusilla CCMP1545]EEH55083.1 glycoside hydrolase family 14 protein [Micromonas pusilla CCMP1545]|eukprot:XP_003060314.1 glycoside hydrolase family 14 protein [Micromonas pusilla CCMP1545]